jgi:drug/metabolite transporter (DMT)-like permease
MTARTFYLTALAMICFAANSVLCRLALAPDLIDPAGFTLVRVFSAAAILTLIIMARRGRRPSLRRANPRSVAALFGYIAFFSFAYVRLDTGTGALILFGAVQFTMFAVALREGERFPLPAWGGLAVAIGGLVYLVLPGLSAPDPLGTALMIVSGIAWGWFSLLGRGAEDPEETIATAFICCLPPATLLAGISFGSLQAAPAGILLGVASGAVTSGLGYVIWYAALRGLKAGQAATVQLSVPAIAAAGGVLLLAEPLSARLVLASAAMLGGIAIVLLQRRPRGG